MTNTVKIILAEMTKQKAFQEWLDDNFAGNESYIGLAKASEIVICRLRRELEKALLRQEYGVCA